MAREPDVALFKTASDSLARRRILADFHQSIAKQQTPPKRPSKCSHWCRLQLSYSPIGQVSVGLKDVVVPCDTNAQLHESYGNPFLNMRVSWLSQPIRFLTPGLHCLLRKCVTPICSQTQTDTGVLRHNMYNYVTFSLLY